MLKYHYMDNKGPIFSANSPSTPPDVSFPVIQNPGYTSEPKKSKNTKIIIIIGSIIAIILIVALVIKGNNSGNSDVENKTMLTTYLRSYNNIIASYKSIETRTEQISLGNYNLIFPVSKNDFSAYESTISYLANNSKDYNSQISKLISSEEKEYLDIQNSNIVAIIANIDFLRLLYDNYINPIESYLNNESSSIECKSISDKAKLDTPAKQKASDSFENILCMASENWLERDNPDLLEEKISSSEKMIFQANSDLLSALQDIEYDGGENDIIKKHIDEIEI